MKHLKHITYYITEKLRLPRQFNAYASFTLTDNEREAIAHKLGNMLGRIGPQSHIKEYEEFVKKLSEDEIDTYNNLYDVFEDPQMFAKEINNNTLNKNEFELIQQFLIYTKKLNNPGSVYFNSGADKFIYYDA